MKLYSLSAGLLAILPLGVAADDLVVASVSNDLANMVLGNAGTCCVGLKLFLGDKVSVEGQSVYTNSLESYFSLQNAQLTPNCIITPTSKEDVALSVFLLNVGSKLLPGRCNFAIRSGGHTPWVGANNIDDGVTIDLSKLNQVNVSKDRKTVDVGPGNRWLDVYGRLETQGLTVVGGRASIVGVGGLTTGGGISYFSPRYGYAVDNIDNFEVVLASGQIVNANSKTNTDLFKALKGGSGNFGIVTSFTMRAYEQGPMWGGFVGFDISTIDKQFAFFESLTGSANYDPYASFILNVVYDQATTSWSASHSVVYSKPVANPPAYQPLLALPQTFNTADVKNLTQLTIELGYSNPNGRRQLFTTATFKNSAAMLSEIYKIAQTNVNSISGISGIKYSLSFQPIPTVINSKAAASGGNSLGLDASDGNLMNMLLTVTWDNKSDDATVESAAKNLFAQANTKAKSLGKFHEYLYLNYAAKWQDPISGYGADSKAKLQAASKKYDPAGLFQKNVPGGFKLF
ncbi:oxidoreductase FAD-binding protein [Microdochium trichocladiopsis]|uniref:Oxidoreductase FAD-binding protein n=1 Tax=Microdochium trichocladiopsis TaxID=1682393 RepID=A0A9P9BSQ8_9PEZI|nr:oxidoreductase FAD-binding protein [Microdochium trichocladiopsis]KAH7029081.1 oxidoreductase FAD-binding protein [Microdochium trichocladiopsis]